MKDLTKAEEQIMHILWRLDKAFVKDILAEMPEPKPAYNTVSTIVRILEKKGMVGHKAYGKTHEYFPAVAKNNYRSFYLKNFLTNYFGGRFDRMMSFFAKENDVSMKELEEMLKYVEEESKDQDTAPGAAPDTKA